MSWWRTLLERRGRTVNSRDPYLAEHFGMRANSAGQFVSEDRATGIAAVHACVQLIAETIASLPLAPYRRTDAGGKTVDTQHPLYNVLHHQANSVLTAFELREMLVASCLLTGNGFALKDIDGRGAVTGLSPIAPGSVRVERLANGRLRYVVGTERYIQDEILHLRYRSKDGVSGLSPIGIARETLGLSLAHQQYESSFFANGARPLGVLQTPHALNAERLATLRAGFNERFAGPHKAGNTLILEEGMEYKQIALSHADAQFVDSRQMNLEEIARIFRVPPPAIGILKEATYSNITEQSRSLVMHTLRPWMVRIEQAMNASLLTPAGRRTHFIEHNAEGLLRGNQKERYESYRIAREWGWLNVNEIRSKENMGGIGPEGDTYRQPMNSEPLGTEHAA